MHEALGLNLYSVSFPYDWFIFYKKELYTFFYLSESFLNISETFNTQGSTLSNFIYVS